MIVIEVILSIIGFVFSGFLAFYIPGRVILWKNQMPKLARIAVAIGIGIVLWALQGIIFGYLHLRFLSYLYLVIFGALFIKNNYWKISVKQVSFNLDIPTIGIVVVGIIGQVLPYLRTGWQTSQGIILSSHNLSDHVWHAALVNELIKRFPPNEPSMSGVLLKDYHYLYNIVAADFIRVFHLPFFETQFIGFYTLAPILLGIIAYYLAQAIWPSKLFTRFSLFLLFFSGNAAGWIMLIMRHRFFWNLSSLINDASKFMDSPPYGYAIVLGLTGLYLLLHFKEKLPKRIIFACAILFGSLLEFKVYVGIPFLIAFGVYSIVSLFEKKYTPFISFIFAGLLAFVLLKSGSSQSAGLIFLPVDIPRDFINQPLLQLTDWQLRWVIFQNHHNIIRLIQYGAYMTGLYLMVQFGLQLFGLFPFPNVQKKLGLSIIGFFLIGSITAFIFGLFFYQTVGGANIWEFFLAASPLLSIVLALNITTLLERKANVIRFIVIAILVIIIIPQWFISVNGYIQAEYFSGFHGVSLDDRRAFTYIATKTPTNSIIFIANQNGYSYASVANMFMNRDLYISGNGVRQIMTPILSKRQKEEVTVSVSTNSQEIQNILVSNHISYVYFYGKPLHQEVLQKAHLMQVFANSSATIFHVQ